MKDSKIKIKFKTAEEKHRETITLSKTFPLIIIGIIFAILMNLSFYDWLNDKSWDWANGFPLGWIGVTLSYVKVFFHEIGHTIFAWFYGYVTVPMFDFQHGGGYAMQLSDQNHLILGIVNLSLLFGAFYWRGYIGLQIACILALIFNLATAFTEIHESIISFMGPGIEPIIAALFLYRFLNNTVEKTGIERPLHAIFGFGFIFHCLISGISLIKNDAYRAVYFKQKAGHGAGDFDKIADNLSWINFNGVIYVWISLSFLCLIIPFGLYIHKLSKSQKNWQR